MANEENLTPWKPGQSGNPKGRPKGRSISKALADKVYAEQSEVIIPNAFLLDTDGKPTGDKVKVLVKLASVDQILTALINKAGRGNIPAIREIFDRLEGKPVQAITTTTPFLAAEKVIIENYKPPITSEDQLPNVEQ